MCHVKSDLLWIPNQHTTWYQVKYCAKVHYSDIATFQQASKLLIPLK